MIEEAYLNGLLKDVKILLGQENTEFYDSELKQYIKSSISNYKRYGIPSISRTDSNYETLVHLLFLEIEPQQSRRKSTEFEIEQIKKYIAELQYFYRSEDGESS